RPEMLGHGCPLASPARVSQVMGTRQQRVEPRRGSQPRRETTMIFRTRHVLGWAAGGLLLIAVSAQPASAAGPVTPNRPAVRPAAPPGGGARRPGGRRHPPRGAGPPISPPNRETRMPGSDWWRIYPWSPYNAWRNPYWYPPYNRNYPYPPDVAYPVYPYPVPQPVPLPPLPIPGGAVGSSHR